MSTRSTRARLGRSFRPAGGPLSLTVGAAVAATLVTGCAGKSPSHAASSPPPSVAPTSGSLPLVTTFATLKNIAQDTKAAADGTVTHPIKAIPVSAAPGGPPVATLPDKELGGPTWVPVVETKPGWQRVLLPSRPNGATGWIADGKDKVRTAYSPYTIKVDTSSRRLSLLKSGRPVGTWTVAVGAPKTPTPVGRTFIMASLAPAKPTYSPLILPVGAHSESLDTFGGGPGTVAFHGWPQKSVFGQAVTHGCVRVPSDALQQLAKVPLGTSVSIAV
ncbi:L,D-transpeptidase [Actinomadura sp. DC4]|uniref:L,D-transpeptidase n=1 Tax=Actinomadura sp. DC4 TaxID=3055069 RepID=UPI0025B0B7F9|nr:L,D-transpeptidase [Actinomadura sp. DC4]MDN3352401.1 L,D-transpeptidase [Actinomadura sp. DC4]